MKNLLVSAAVMAICALPVFAQSESSTTSTAEPGTLSDQSPVDPGVGKEETKYVEADGYVNKKKFWSDDTVMVAAVLGGIAAIGGGVFFMKRKKAE